MRIKSQYLDLSIIVKRVFLLKKVDNSKTATFYLMSRSFYRLQIAFKFKSTHRKEVSVQYKREKSIQWKDESKLKGVTSSLALIRVAHFLAGKQETGKQVPGYFLQENGIFSGNFLVLSKLAKISQFQEARNSFIHRCTYIQLN